MRRNPSLLTVCAAGSFAAFAAIMLPAARAHAHISLEMAGTHLSRSGDAATSLKGAPCGVEGSVRNTDPAHIYTYEPGAVVTLSVIETIPHPGYFRIAFDDDGDDGFADPKSIKPIDPNRGCPCTSFGCGGADHCDKDDFYNNATVLPNMDNLNPHLNAASGTKYTWQVTMPNIECDHCTLQIIQVMEDPLGHGPYDNVSDVYHQCVEIVLKHGAGTGGPGGSAGTGGGAGAAGESSGSAGIGAAAGIGASGTGATAGVNGGGAGVVANQTGNDTGGGAGAAGVSAASAGNNGAPRDSSTSTCSVGGDGAFASLFAPIALSLLAPLFGRRRKQQKLG